MKSEFELAGVSVDSLAYGRIAGLLRARAGLCRWTDSRGIDLLHTQGIRADCLAASVSRPPRLATLRNYPYADYPMTYGRIGKLMAAFHCAGLRRLSRVAVVSHGVQSAVAGHAVTAEVIANGVETGKYSVPTEVERAAARRELGLTEGSPVIVSIGHLSERKNPIVVIEAALAQPAGQLIMLGDGPIGPELRRRYGGNDRVRFPGRQADVRPWLWAADVFVSASRAEGLPNAVLEAMACGLPCVLSDIEPHRELLGENDTMAGVLVDGASARSVARGIQRTLALGPGAGSNARASVEAYFSADVMAQRYVELYRSLAPYGDHAAGCPRVAGQ